MQKQSHWHTMQSLEMTNDWSINIDCNKLSKFNKHTHKHTHTHAYTNRRHNTYNYAIIVCIDSNTKTFFIIIIIMFRNIFYKQLFKLIIYIILFISQIYYTYVLMIRQFRISSQFEAYKSFCYTHTKEYITLIIYIIYVLVVSIIIFAMLLPGPTNKRIKQKAKKNKKQRKWNHTQS